MEWLHVIKNEIIIYLKDDNNLKDYINLLVFDYNDDVIGYIDKDGNIVADKNDEGCSFCNEGRNMLSSDDNDISIYKTNNICINYSTDSYGHETTVEDNIEVSYCPICGKQLR